MSEWAMEAEKELDFQRESENVEMVAKGLAERPQSRVWVPRPIPEVPATEKMLLLEFANAVKVTDLDALDRHGVDRNVLLRDITEAFAEQIFRIGVFSGDPHPGNILVDISKGHGVATPVLLDFGLAKRLTDTMRLAFCKCVIGSATKDYFLLLESFDEMVYPLPLLTHRAMPTPLLPLTLSK
jgi:aarF domain-containing kinase